MKFYCDLKNSLALALMFWPLVGFSQLLDVAVGWDEETAIKYSQASIGRQLGDYRFTRTDGSTVSLADYTGKPLLISLIFTSCHHVCPITTKRLAEAVGAAREVMEEGAFNVVTIGFDTPKDTPDAMRMFATQQSVHDSHWDFLSADAATIERLTTELGFIYYRSPRGFDHITQVSVIERGGTVYRQVYGAQFELPWLVEPLKELVFNRPAPDAGHFAGLLGRIRLFCTVYDPATDRYHFDYSLFLQIGIGFLAIFGIGWFLVQGSRRHE